MKQNAKYNIGNDINYHKSACVNNFDKSNNIIITNYYILYIYSSKL